MKRIYLLMTLALGLSTAAQAQRSVNLEMTQMYPTSMVAVSADEDPDMQTDAWAGNSFSIKAKNLGPDVLNADDTIIVGIALYGGFIHGNISGLGGLAVGDECFFNFGVSDNSYTYDPDVITESTSEVLNLCDTMYAVDQSATAIPDPDLSNNHNCTNMTFNYWFLAVNDVNSVSGFAMFPNPAATKLNLTSTFNGAKNASVIIRDVVGKTVFSQNLGSNLNGQRSFVLDINNIPSGMYIVDLNVDGQRVSRQMSVQK